jgi:hyperosmotically inducible protein
MKRLLLLLIPIVFFSCGQSDEKIQLKVNHKLATSTGRINATVNDGVVTLTGECPDEPCKMASEAAVREIKGVKEVVNNVTIFVPPPAPPVAINPDDTLTTTVNNIVANYKTVNATVKDGVVTLTGTLPRAELQNLMQQLNAAKPKRIENKLEIK